MKKCISYSAILFSALLIFTAPCKAQWVNTNLFVYAPADPFVLHDSIVFAGTNGRGVYKSADSGGSWAPSNGGLPPNENIMALAVNGNTIFVSTADSCVYRSTNNGVSWTPARSGLIYAVSYYLYVYGLFAMGTSTFAATNEGVYVTIDNGISWLQRDTGITNPQWAYLQTFCNNNPYIFTGGGDCLFRSSDDGATWAEADSGLLQAGYIHSLVALGDTIIAGTGSGVYLSTNDGDYWAPVTSGIPAGTVNCLDSVSSGKKTLIFAGTSSGVYLSTDSGRTWTDKNAGLTLDKRVNSLTMYANRLIASTNYNGIFTSTNFGASWDSSFSQLPRISPNIYSFLVTDSSIYAGGNGIFRTTDDGEHWNSVGAQVPLGTNALALSGPNLLAGTNGGLHISNNAGVTWKYVTMAGNSQGIANLTTNGNDVYAGTGSGVFYSANNGEVWVPTSRPPSSLDGGVAVVAVNDSFVFVGTNDVFGDGGMFRSSDKGITWNGDEDGMYSLTNVSIITTNNGDSSLSSSVFAYYGNTLVRSTDNGSQWEVLDTNSKLTNGSYINAIAVDDSLVFIGTDNGVLLSKDNGTSWQWDTVGLPPNTRIDAFAFKDSTVFAGSYYGGLWKRIGVKPVKLPHEAVTAHEKAQTNLDIFPNPCSRSASVIFNTTSSGIADVSIFNALGIEVSNLFSGWIAAGEHPWQWSKSTEIQPGVYECVVRMNGQVSCRLVIVE
jgi:photosystem II stability/assembly factor-like uncharacterized protein